MARITYFVALPFLQDQMGGLIPGQARECPDRIAAERAARAMIEFGFAGSVAFSRSGDPNTGEFDDADIIGQFGERPIDRTGWSPAAA